jgi:hypothetical protein
MYMYFYESTALVGQVLLNGEVYSSHSVGFLWTSDRPATETFTRQHTSLTRDGHPCPRRDSNP